MNTCYYYLIVEPLLAEYVDNGMEPVSYAVVETRAKSYRVSFFTTHNQLYMIRIEVPSVPGEIIPESDLEKIQTIKEHILSVLRLSYDHNVSLFPRTIWNFKKEGQKPKLNVKIDEIINPNFAPHVENIRNVFVTTFPIRTQIKLLSDSQDKRLPLQYRYLSLYKLLEIVFKRKGKWSDECDDFVNGFEKEFKDLGIRMKPINYIHCLRDRCAHVKTGKEVLGITQLSNKDMLEVSTFLPLMTRICVSIIDKKYHDRGFSLVDYETFSQRLHSQESTNS